jgi:hypothetical protein
MTAVTRGDAALGHKSTGLVALSRGFAAARRREFQAHREWMLRAAAIGTGIATVRVVAFPGLSTAIAEWWIGPPPKRPRP